MRDDEGLLVETWEQDSFMSGSSDHTELSASSSEYSDLTSSVDEEQARAFQHQLDQRYVKLRARYVFMKDTFSSVILAMNEKLDAVANACSYTVVQRGAYRGDEPLSMPEGFSERQCYVFRYGRRQFGEVYALNASHGVGPIGDERCFGSYYMIATQSVYNRLRTNDAYRAIGRTIQEQLAGSGAEDAVVEEAGGGSAGGDPFARVESYRLKCKEQEACHEALIQNFSLINKLLNKKFAMIVELAGKVSVRTISTFVGSVSRETRHLFPRPHDMRACAPQMCMVPRMHVEPWVHAPSPLDPAQDTRRRQEKRWRANHSVLVSLNAWAFQDHPRSEEPLASKSDHYNGVAIAVDVESIATKVNASLHRAFLIGGIPKLPDSHLTLDAEHIASAESWLAEEVPFLKRYCLFLFEFQEALNQVLRRATKVQARTGEYQASKILKAPVGYPRCHYLWAGAQNLWERLSSTERQRLPHAKHFPVFGTGAAAQHDASAVFGETGHKPVGVYMMLATRPAVDEFNLHGKNLKVESRLQADLLQVMKATFDLEDETIRVSCTGPKGVPRHALPLRDSIRALVYKGMMAYRQPVRPPSIPGWLLYDVPRDGNDFYHAVLAQLAEHHLGSATTAEALRERVQGKKGDAASKYRDGEWTRSVSDILKMAQALDVVIAVMKTHGVSDGWMYHYALEDGTGQQTCDVSTLPEKSILRLVDDGMCYFSAVRHEPDASGSPGMSA